MAAPETLACWTATTQDEQNYWLYVAAGGSEMSLACFAATTSDEQTWLIYQQLGGGGGGSPAIVVSPAPTNLSDFSMFPGGVAPATGEYFALDESWIYSFDATTDTTWQETARSN